MKDYVKCITVADAVEILLKDCIRYVFPTTAEPTTEFIKLNNAINLLQLYPSADVAPRWIPCEERLPKDLEVVNITWINHRPMTYYADIKDKPFTATAIHYEDKWWWYSPICEDMLAECGKSECDEMDADIEVTAWMPLPEPYVAERKNDD